MCQKIGPNAKGLQTGFALCLVPMIRTYGLSASVAASDLEPTEEAAALSRYAALYEENRDFVDWLSNVFKYYQFYEAQTQEEFYRSIKSFLFMTQAWKQSLKIR